jgi:hypothetical protein
VWNSVRNVAFCKRRPPEEPTEKDAILRDVHTVAFSGVQEVPEVQDIQNQVEILTGRVNAEFVFAIRQPVALVM